MFVKAKLTPRSRQIRDALAVLGAHGGAGGGQACGRADDVDPVMHLIGTSIGRGGNPREAAVYESRYLEQNDGNTAHWLRVGDVPVDGFWSVSVYNRDGYFEKNDRSACSVNNLTARKEGDGSILIRFGGNPEGAGNYLPITPGWNYTVRLYRPHRNVLDGSWKFPQARPAGSAP